MQDVTRNWLVRFQFDKMLTMEQTGEFKASPDLDEVSARLMFSNWLKEAHPELSGVRIVSFEPSPIPDKQVSIVTPVEDVQEADQEEVTVQ